MLVAGLHRESAVERATSAAGAFLAVTDGWDTGWSGECKRANGGDVIGNALYASNGLGNLSVIVHSLRSSRGNGNDPGYNI